MSKKNSSLLNLVVVLTLISLVAAVALGAVYVVTKKPIEDSQAKKKQDAMSLVLPNFTGTFNKIKVLANEGDKDSVLVNLAYQDDQFFGAAVETYTDRAFSGSFTIMVGFDAEGNILGNEVLEMGETPGLGDKIDKNKSDFSRKFISKNPAEFSLKVKKDGGDVDAITAATISSRAFCDAVQRAYNAFLQSKPQQEQEVSTNN